MSVLSPSGVSKVAVFMRMCDMCLLSWLRHLAAAICKCIMDNLLSCIMPWSEKATVLTLKWCMRRMLPQYKCFGVLLCVISCLSLLSHMSWTPAVTWPCLVPGTARLARYRVPLCTLRLELHNIESWVSGAWDGVCERYDV